MQSFQLYTPGDSFLYRLDPRTKLLAVGVVFLFSILFTDARFLAPIFFAVLTVIVVGRVPLRRVALLLRSLTLLVVIAMVMWPLIYQDGPVLFRLLGRDVTQGGVFYGLGMSFRILDMVIAPIALFLTTPQTDFVAGLRGLGLPYKGSFALATAFRFLPTVVGVGQSIIEAQRARGLDPSRGNALTRLRNYGRVLGPLMITSIRLAQQMVLAVEAKAFSISTKRTFLRHLQFRRADVVALSLVALVAVVGLTVRFQGYGLL